MFDDKNQNGLPNGLPQNSNQIVIVETEQILFFDKNEISERCEISVHTFQKWLDKRKPLDYQVKILEKGKKIYREDYLKILFEKFGDLKDFEKLKIKNGLPNGLSEDLLASKDETIKTLQKFNTYLVNQAANQQNQIKEILETVKELRNLEIKKFESKKKAESPENLPKKTNQNWWISLLAFFKPNKPKIISNDK